MDTSLLCVGQSKRYERETGTGKWGEQERRRGKETERTEAFWQTFLPTLHIRNPSGSELIHKGGDMCVLVDD